SASSLQSRHIAGKRGWKWSSKKQLTTPGSGNATSIPPPDPYCRFENSDSRIGSLDAQSNRLLHSEFCNLHSLIVVRWKCVKISSWELSRSRARTIRSPVSLREARHRLLEIPVLPKSDAR